MERRWESGQEELAEGQQLSVQIIVQEEEAPGQSEQPRPMHTWRPGETTTRKVKTMQDTKIKK